MPEIPGSLKLSVSDEGGRAVVVAEGELDLYTSPRLREVLTERIDGGNPHLASCVCLRQPHQGIETFRIAMLADGSRRKITHPRIRIIKRLQ